MDLRKRILPLLWVIVGIMALSTAGFHYIEGWGWLDSLYATVVTLGTVGYGDFVPKDDLGKIYVIFLIIVGISTISYVLLQLTAFVVEGHLQRMLRLRKVDNLIKKMEGHYIICGAGNMGRHIVAELIKNKAPFVVIDRDVKKLEEHGIHEHPHLTGDATDDNTLKRAGIGKAKALAAALETDEVNLFLALTAKNLNHDIRVVAKCLHESSRSKLQRAGADAIVAPNYIGGLRIASEMLRPNVVNFLDIMLRSSQGVRFEEAHVPLNSGHAGKTLESLDLFHKFGLQPIALREGGKTFLYNPPPKHHVKGGDTLVVIGEPEKVQKLKKFLAA